MKKAEAVVYEGQPVPNWVALCRDILLSGPALILVAVTLIGLLTVWWERQRPAYSDISRSQPAANVQLQVTDPTSSGSYTPAASATQPIGPAPSDSLNSLQSAGSTQNNASGLSQATTQTVQSAGGATNDAMQGLGL